MCGGPGSGKGTNCSRIAEEFGYVHLSAGDLLRAEVASKSELGSTISGLMADGKLVPDDVTIELIHNAMLANQDKNRFLVDGFPRSVEQSVKFEKAVAPCQMVLNFDCADEVMTARILERGKTSGRVDDNEEAIKKRLDTFYSQTRPVVDYFRPIGRLRNIDANGSAEEVYAATRKVFLLEFTYLFGTSGMRVESCVPGTSNFAHIDARKIYTAFVKNGGADKEQDVAVVGFGEGSWPVQRPRTSNYCC